MSHQARVPHTSPPKRIGPTFVAGASIVGATLFSFWYFLGRQQVKREEVGAVPHYEQLLAHVGKKETARIGPLPTSEADRRDPPLPTDNHNTGHDTIQATAKKNDSNGETKWQVPSPQRGQTGDSSKAYTKSPAYVDNYGKTNPE